MMEATPTSVRASCERSWAKRAAASDDGVQLGPLSRHLRPLRRTEGGVYREQQRPDAENC